MRKALRAVGLIVALTFKADPVRAAWLVIRSPINMCSMLGTAYGLKLLTDAVVAGNDGAVLRAAALLVAVLLLGTLASVGSLSARAMVIEKSSLLIDRRLMESALQVPGLEHHETPWHRDQIELLKLRRGELGEVVDAVGHNLGILLLTAGSVFLLAQIDPLLVLLPLAAIPSVWASPRAERMRVIAQEQTVDGLRSARHLFELATSAGAGKEVRLFGLGPTLLTRHSALWDRADRVQNTAAWRGGMLAAGGWLVFSAAYVAAIGLVVLRVADGKGTPGDVLMAVQLAAGINRTVQGIVFMAGWLRGQIRTAGRALWLMDYASARRQATAGAVTVPDRLRSGITLEQVTFCYPDTRTDVISGLSLRIAAGTTVAVVGENGAGKSTLVKLLARFYDPAGGRILVDGVDLRRFDPADWRAHWAAGFQDFARFELLARETVGVGDLSRIGEEAAIGAALDRAAAADVVGSLPAGGSTPLGRTFDDGVELSGGQWQKLALGRAMMRPEPLVLVLDEPTASLDAMTEHELFARYAAGASRVAAETGAITILVSHRFSTVRMADLIVVMDAGRLREAGCHEELMAQGGLYAELYELQARAYR